MSDLTLPTGWSNVTLGDISRVQSGVGFPKKFQGKTKGDYPVYKVGDVSKAVQNKGGILSSSSNYVTSDEALELRGYIYPKGSVLFAKIGEALKLNRRGYVMLPGLADNNVMGIKADLSDQDRFLFYYLKNVDMATLSRSTTIPSVRKTDVEAIEIDLPPLNEQARIANKLDELLAQVDTIKARVDAIPAILNRFRQSVLAAAVSGKLTEEWREKRNVSIEDGWETYQLSELVQPGRPISYGVLKPGEHIEDGVLLLRIKDIINDKIDQEKVHRISHELSEQYKRTLLTGDEVLVSLVGTIGRIAFVPKVLKGANVHRNLGVIATCEKILPRFLYFQMKASQVQRQILAAKTGANQPLLNLGDIKKFSIEVPSLLEQEEIVDRIDELLVFSNQIEQRVKDAQSRIDNLTQSILAKAFRGELVPQDPNDEPASELLERIKKEREEAAALAKAAKKVGKKKAKAS